MMTFTEQGYMKINAALDRIQDLTREAAGTAAPFKQLGTITAEVYKARVILQEETCIDSRGDTDAVV